MENGPDEVTRLREDVARLRAALEDVVALALSGGDARQRSALMHRRAIAALSGSDARPASKSASPPRGS
jgi:hypothetical protein